VPRVEAVLARLEATVVVAVAADGANSLAALKLPDNNTRTPAKKRRRRRTMSSS